MVHWRQDPAIEFWIELPRSSLGYDFERELEQTAMRETGGVDPMSVSIEKYCDIVRRLHLHRLLHFRHGNIDSLIARLKDSTYTPPPRGHISLPPKKHDMWEEIFRRKADYPLEIPVVIPR